jgi:hypothetical protein
MVNRFATISHANYRDARKDEQGFGTPARIE